MKKSLFIFILMCAAVAVNAQNSVKDSSSVSSSRKNELYVDTQGGLNYRRNFNKVSLRVRVASSFNSSTSKNDNQAQHGRGYSISPSIGIQKNVNLGSGFQFYWGADLFYNYYENYYRNVHSFPTNSYTDTDMRTSQGIGIAPLVGVKYNYKRLILGAESLASFQYAEDKTTTSYSSGTTNHSLYSRFDFSSPLRSPRVYIGINF